MKTYQAEIIGVGTELLLGQIANTNAQWISEQLANQGISVYYHQVVGDNLSRTRDVFASAAQRSDLVFVTGGLGPTEDDLTREALQQLTQKPLIEKASVLKEIEAYFVKRNREMTMNNRKQAQVFADAVVIPNHVGTAPGMIVPFNTSHFIIMPGVPSEMKVMMTEFVLPYLRENFALKDLIKSKMLKFIGIGESQLETKVQKIISQQSNPTIAPLASNGEVALRITAKAQEENEADALIDQAKNLLLRYLGDYYYGDDQTTMTDVVVQQLKSKNLTIAAAESLTGGRFSDEILSIPGTSQVFKGSIVSYTNDAKRDVLGVSETTITSEGTVSEQCAKEMARQAKIKFGASIGISFTGVAGPDSVENKEVGTVFISVYQSEDAHLTEGFHFSKERDMIRNRTVKKGLEILHHWLKND